MTYVIPENVNKALITGLLSATETTCDGGFAKAIQNTISTVLETYLAEMPADMRMRLIRIKELMRHYLEACRDLDQACAPDQAAPQLDRVTRLRKEFDEAWRFLGLPLSAESLIKAENFDAFCAQLLNVDLGQLYHSGRKEMSQFPLIWAISARDRPLQRVQLMLAVGADVRLKTTAGETVLHAMAAMKRKAAIRLPILRLLIFKGADLEAVNIYEETPLTVAIDRGSREDVAFFLAAGSVVRLCDFKRATRDPKTLKLLLERVSQQDARLRDAAGLGGWLRGEIKEWELTTKHALQNGAKGDWHAKVHGNLTQSLALLADLPGYRPQDDTRKVTWQEEPGAFWAIQAADSLDAFRDALARVDITTFHMGGTHPIYWPFEAKEDRPQRLWLMLSAGASVEGGANGTALHIFAKQTRKDAAEQFRLAQMLVQAGADLEARNWEGKTPLTIATERRGYAEAAALLQLGASPKVSLSTRRLFGDRLHAPLIFSAADEPKIFKSLLEIGVGHNEPDSDGNTLRDYLEQEVLRLTAMLDTDMSGNLTRRVQRGLNSITKSITILKRYQKQKV